MKLLLIEDNLSLQTTLVRTLVRQGYEVSTCADGLQALACWRNTQPDLVLLDLSLPGRDGLTVLGEARAQGLAAPVIILTARGTVGDRILGLNTGADDYLAKPFDLDELEARIKALLRRSPAGQAAGGTAGRLGGGLAVPGGAVQGVSPSGGFDVDRDSGAVYFQGEPLDLPPRELALLRALLARPGQAMAKERLFEQVFPGELDVQTEAIEVVAYRLRKRLAATGAQLVTLRGLGYLLKLAPQGA
ncbi:response regulator transcription factor [Hydrogenophaga soli]